MNLEEINDTIESIERRCSETTNGIICENCRNLPEFIICRAYRELEHKLSVEQISSLEFVSCVRCNNSIKEIVALKDLLLKKDQMIKKVLEDEESGKGWGPDVTTCAYLQEALDLQPGGDKK